MSRAPTSTPLLITGRSLAGARLVERTISIRGGGFVDPDPALPAWSLGPEKILFCGFRDHHTHLVGTYRTPSGPDLEGAASRDECLARLRRWLDENPGERPVLGEGWDESAWSDRRMLTGEEIDAISPARPVALRRVCGHLAVANRRAWSDLQPTGPNADPATGTLYESLAMGLPRRWPPGPAAYLEGVRVAQEVANRMGVVAADEMGRAETYLAFRSFAERDRLTIEVDHYFPLESWREQVPDGSSFGERIGRLSISGVKGFLDGSIGARTAAMESGFTDRDATGALLWERDRLIDAVRDASAAGAAVALHAIGRRAVSLALEAYEAVRGEGMTANLLRVEHAEEVDLEIIERAARLDLVLSMQPNFTARWQGAGGLYERAIGESRARRLNPYRSASRLSALRFGSDTMPFDPFLGLRGALSHPDPGERLSVAEALAAYSTGGISRGYARDRLAPGEPATLAVLAIPGGDPERALLEGTAHAVWTVIDGKTVYFDSGDPPPEPFLEATR